MAVPHSQASSFNSNDGYTSSSGQQLRTLAAQRNATDEALGDDGRVFLLSSCPILISYMAEIQIADTV